MKRLSLRFSEPYRVDVVEESVAAPTGNQVLVRTLVSAISPGTELLVYTNQWPPDVPVDETISSLSGSFSYPLTYGYAAVGRVEETGSRETAHLLGKTVFSFNPHQSRFLVAADELIPVPPSLSPEEAVFLPNMETAVCMVMDGKPSIGDAVLVFGQGIVGLLTTSLLARFPLACLISADSLPFRRQTSVAQGATQSLDPSDSHFAENIREIVAANGATDGADLTYELSGSPTALDTAIAVTGFSGRVVVGSWYGKKTVSLNLGGRFHRGRIQVMSSQVSTIAPEHRGRWTKSRRLQTALRLLEQVRPAKLITHRFSLLQAAQAYALLDQNPETAIQVIFHYEDGQ